jgi:organic hydroperoxide reductase OsmC/OhrA
VETEDRVLVITRIHVRYHLRLRAEQRDAAERAHGAHQSHCPVARTLRGAVDVTTELALEVEG